MELAVQGSQTSGDGIKVPLGHIHDGIRQNLVTKFIPHPGTVDPADVVPLARGQALGSLNDLKFIGFFIPVHPVIGGADILAGVFGQGLVIRLIILPQADADTLSLRKGFPTAQQVCTKRATLVDLIKLQAIAGITAFQPIDNGVKMLSLFFDASFSHNDRVKNSTMVITT